MTRQASTIAPRELEQERDEEDENQQESEPAGNIALDMSGGNNVATVDTISNTGSLASSPFKNVLFAA